MSENWMMELYRGPFEDPPPLLVDLCDDEPIEPAEPQEGASVRPEGTMES